LDSPEKESTYPMRFKSSNSSTPGAILVKSSGMPESGWIVCFELKEIVSWEVSRDLLLLKDEVIRRHLTSEPETERFQVALNVNLWSLLQCPKDKRLMSLNGFFKANPMANQSWVELYHEVVGMYLLTDNVNASVFRRLISSLSEVLIDRLAKTSDMSIISLLTSKTVLRASPMSHFSRNKARKLSFDLFNDINQKLSLTTSLNYTEFQQKNQWLNKVKNPK